MDTLTPNQQQLFEKVRAESRNRAQQVIRRAKLNKEQRRRLYRAKEKLGRAAIVLNINLHGRYRDARTIDGLLGLERVLNLVEVADFPDGIYDQRFRSRLLNEFKIYGASRDVQIIFSHMRDSERPNYGALDYLNTSSSTTPAGYYGRYRFILKQELKTRSTFTPFDSFATERDQVYVWENIEGVLATKLNGRFWFEHVLQDSEPRTTEEGVHYIEAQILGGVRLPDIERLYYPAADCLDHDFFPKLQRLEIDHGIQLVHY